MTNKQYFNNYARPMIVRLVFSSLMYTAAKLIAALFIGASALVATTLISPLMFFIAVLSSFFISGLGAREEFLILSMDYLKFFSLSFPLLLLGKGLDVLILNDGSPKYSFVLNIVTTVSNLVLNIIAVVLLEGEKILFGRGSIWLY
jgi:Na+-driven multidrug efflux pump